MINRLRQVVSVGALALLLLSVVGGLVTGVRAILSAQRAIEESASRGAFFYLGKSIKVFIRYPTLEPAASTRGLPAQLARLLEEAAGWGTSSPFAYHY